MLYKSDAVAISVEKGVSASVSFELMGLMFYSTSDTSSWEDSTGNGGPFSTTSTGAFSIGQEYDGGPSTSNFYSGDIGEIRVWSDARTETEISENWDHTLTGNEAGLVAYYPCSNISGTELTDATGNGHDGTIHGQ